MLPCLQMFQPDMLYEPLISYGRFEIATGQ